MTSQSIDLNIAQLRAKITACENRYHRPPHSVRLLAVSKQQPLYALEQAYAVGLRDFGENQVQSALVKIAVMPSDCEWHFIGTIQSNKTALIATHFDWVHSLDRDKIATRLSEQRLAANLAPLNVCIQVNASEEKTKSGVSLDLLPSFAAYVNTLAGLRLRGLMTIPKPSAHFEEQCMAFQKVRNCFNTFLESGLMLDTLSMGMSHDIEAAIASGSTLVRIGEAIFGPRKT